MNLYEWFIFMVVMGGIQGRWTLLDVIQLAIHCWVLHSTVAYHQLIDHCSSTTINPPVHHSRFTAPWHCVRHATLGVKEGEDGRLRQDAGLHRENRWQQGPNRSAAPGRQTASHAFEHQHGSASAKEKPWRDLMDQGVPVSDENWWELLRKKKSYENWWKLLIIGFFLSFCWILSID